MRYYNIINKYIIFVRVQESGYSNWGCSTKVSLSASAHRASTISCLWGRVGEETAPWNKSLLGGKAARRLDRTVAEEAGSCRWIARGDPARPRRRAVPEEVARRRHRTASVAPVAFRRPHWLRRGRRRWRSTARRSLPLRHSSSIRRCTTMGDWR